MSFSLKSPAFQDGEAIPEIYVRDGENKSPPLRWSDPPAETRSFMLIVEDPDSPSGIFRHWAVHDLDRERRELPEGAGGVAAGLGRQGRNDFGDVGYDGPQPPLGDGVHRYHFRLAALDVAHLDIPDEAEAAAVLDAARRHVIDEVQMTGVYAR